MKIKWFIAAVILLALLLQIPFAVKPPQQITFELGKERVTASIGKLRVRGSGKALLDSVKLYTIADTFTVRRIAVHVSLLKVTKLKGAEPIVRRHLKALQFDSLATDFTSLGLKKIDIEGCSGRFQKMPFANTSLTLKRRGKIVKGSGVVESITLWGKNHPKQRFEFVLQDGLIKGSVDGSIGGGSVDAEFTYALAAKQFSKLAVTGKKIDLKKTIPFALDGIASMQFKSTSANSEPIAGTGIITVKNFADRESDLLQELRRTLKLVGVNTLQFNEISVPFSLKNNRITTDSLRADGSSFDVDASGSVKIKNLSYNLTVTGHLAPSMESTVSRIIWGGLDRDPSTGGRSFTGTVVGQGEEYSVKVDKRIIRQGARSFFKNLFN